MRTLLEGIMIIIALVLGAAIALMLFESELMKLSNSSQKPKPATSEKIINKRNVINLPNNTITIISIDGQEYLISHKGSIVKHEIEE